MLRRWLESGVSGRQARSTMSDKTEYSDNTPVYVIETIPVGWKHQISKEETDAEGIPTPSHLAVYPELGRGGMGRIHPAIDKTLLRFVAMKRLDTEMAQVSMYRDGFVAEAQITGQLEHPNIVPVHELKESERGAPYFTMKLVQGVSLDEWQRDPSRAIGATERLHDGLEIFLKVCDAVAYAHHRGVIHRDLKPENIMVADFGQVYLMDWGLARLTKTRPASGEDSQMEAEGAVGTPDFMAPEQARGNPAQMDERSDIFGLGAVLYELVSGQAPYGRLSDPDVTLERARQGRVIALEHAAGSAAVPKALCDIVNRAVAPDPNHRYQRVIDLQADVRKFLRGGMYLPRQTFAPKALIMREGDPGETAYMIVSGRCRAYRNTETGEETLSTMGQGEVFGEMALILDAPRAATVEAIDVVTVLVLDKETITKGLGIDGWTGALVRALAKRFRNLEQQVREHDFRRHIFDR
jgi:eukaryotic-like serine/threonine-protein kinase